MLRRYLIALTFAFSCIHLLHADVVVEGEVDIWTKVTNLSEFPEYSFYIEYQGYYYEYGWQPGEIVEVPLKEGEEFLASDRGGSSAIFAREGNGVVSRSEILVGGNTTVENYDIDHLLQEYSIVRVADGVVEVKLQNSYQVFKNGKQKKVNKGMVLTGIDFFGIDLGTILLPLVCLGGLIFFFWMRRNPVREQAA